MKVVLLGVMLLLVTGCQEPSNDQISLTENLQINSTQNVRDQLRDNPPLLKSRRILWQENRDMIERYFTDWEARRSQILEHVAHTEDIDLEHLGLLEEIYKTSDQVEQYLGVTNKHLCKACANQRSDVDCPPACSDFSGRRELE